MSEREKIELAIGCFIEAMNTDNAQIIPLAEDVVLCGPTISEPIRGEAAVRQYLGDTAPLIARMTLKMSVIENDRAALLMEFEGLNGVITEGAYFFRFEGGLICFEQVFFDPQTMIIEPK